MTEPITPTAATPAKPRKKRRVFLWVFLAIQALFIAWIVAAANTASSCSPTDINFEACQAGEAIGGGVAYALIIGLWVAVDLILGIGYIVYKLARR